MESPRTAASLEFVRRLAIDCLNAGAAPVEVADLLRVSERSVWRWLAAARADPAAGLNAKPGRGRPPKLSATQAGEVLGWFERSPCDFGFPTERWTAPRVAAQIARRFGVSMNPRCLNDWLRRHRITPQIPETRPRERDPVRLRAWLAQRWPRIKKTRSIALPP